MIHNFSFVREIEHIAVILDEKITKYDNAMSRKTITVKTNTRKTIRKL